MNVGAHPLVVAVALGLLSPVALAAPEERRAAASCDDDAPRCDGCDCARTPTDDDAAFAEQDVVAAFDALAR